MVVCALRCFNKQNRWFMGWVFLLPIFCGLCPSTVCFFFYTSVLAMQGHNLKTGRLVFWWREGGILVRRLRLPVPLLVGWSVGRLVGRLVGWLVGLVLVDCLLAWLAGARGERRDAQRGLHLQAAALCVHRAGGPKAPAGSGGPEPAANPMDCSIPAVAWSSVRGTSAPTFGHGFGLSLATSLLKGWGGRDGHIITPFGCAFFRLAPHKLSFGPHKLWFSVVVSRSQTGYQFQTTNTPISTWPTGLLREPQPKLTETERKSFGIFPKYWRHSDIF